MRFKPRIRQFPLIGAAVLVLFFGAIAPTHATIVDVFGEIDFADPNPFGLSEFDSISGVIDWDETSVTGSGIETIGFNSVKIVLGSEILFGDSSLGDFLTFEDGDLVGVNMFSFTSDLDWDFFMAGSAFDLLSWSSGNFVSGSFDFTGVSNPVPEPSAFLLFAAGLLGFSRYASSRRNPVHKITNS
ncbi:MAG: PEP-CTERM sorting domain-containing protein [Gammaproteobacteria bacterium]|nr:PEP-CTERM sorting domain-containing protein [Gammaproteobacteria bacterium]